MSIRENPSWQLFVALGMLLMGMYIGIEAINRPSAEEEATMARALRPRSSPVGRARASRGLQAAMSLVSISCGVGLGLYGLRQLRRQGELLVDGVPVIGRITHIRQPPKRSAEITYCFKDDHGIVREGVYYSVLGGGLVDGFSEGQEITVIYDPADPRKHMLDVDNVRRAEAAVRHL